MRSEDSLKTIFSEYDSELHIIRNQIIQYFKLIIKTYIGAKAQEMEGVIAPKPLPTPPRSSSKTSVDPRKKPLPPSPGVKKQPVSLKITDVIDQLQKDINTCVIRYFNSSTKQELAQEEEEVLRSIEDEYTETLQEPNFRTKICSDLTYINEEIIKPLIE